VDLGVDLAIYLGLGDWVWAIDRDRSTEGSPVAAQAGIPLLAGGAPAGFAGPATGILGRAVL
jgi:hypothetical protein